MLPIIQIIIALLGLGAVGFLIVKKYNPTIVLLTVGLILLALSLLMGRPIFADETLSTGFSWLDPFKVIQQTFLSQLGMIGLTLMSLFGFASYMTHIGANDVTVNALIRPVKSVKSVYVLVPVVFLLGNLLSLVVPSASSLAVLLLATLYPTLKKAKMSSLTAAAIIATTATIIPTPLGADNVIAAEKLGIDLMSYVYKMHALVSIPSLLLMAVAHFFWQRYMDKKHGESAIEDLDINDNRADKKLPPSFYGIFPVLPLAILLGLFVFQIFGIFKDIKLDVVTVTFISFIIALLTEAIRARSFKKITDDGQVFFKGMGEGMGSVVTLVVAAGIMVEGFKAIGIIDLITASVEGVSGAGSILALAFTGATTLIGIISGSGLSFFYAMIGIVPEIADGVGINGAMVSLPMQMAANLSRTLSPVSAVIVIVAGSVKKTPIDVLKRTAVPTAVGLVAVTLLSILVLPQF
jgi:DcuC family C4-dicarboxylate transporter